MTTKKYNPLSSDMVEDGMMGNEEFEDERDGELSARKKSSNSETAAAKHIPIGFSFSIRYLAVVVLVLFSVSHALLLRQCRVAAGKQRVAGQPLVQEMMLVTKHKSITIQGSPRSSGGYKNEVEPGQIVEVYGNRTGSNYHHILSPSLGFAIKNSSSTGLNYFEPLAFVKESSFCPLMYEGWWPEGKRTRTFLYAPPALVLAQQLWNACQVFTLFLWIALVYECCLPNIKMRQSTRSTRKWTVLTLCVGSLCILPFSVYLISPGGHTFATFAFCATMIALFTPMSNLRLSIGENETEALGDSTIRAWTLSREETVACFCNLGSSLYNYAGSIRTWPHWKRYMYRLDDFMAWPRKGDCTVDADFTLGLPNVRVPLFVSRASGSRTGAQVFAFVWSVLPFLYVTYFGCMFLLATRSPGVRIQRALCLFGICHFLLGTDVVDYRYGRGYKTPHSEFFHWTEKWSWRIAILLPIFQNCTNGHWKSGHRYFPLVGKIMTKVLIVWGFFFFCFQVIQSDIVKFSQYMLSKHQEGLIDKFGLDHTFFFRSVRYPYREALVTMIIMYGLLHCCCFKTYRIFLRRAEGALSATELQQFDEDAGLLGPDSEDEEEEAVRTHRL